MSQLESRNIGAEAAVDPSAHLTDDQFTDCAIGLKPGITASRHLAHCELCRGELAAFGLSVDNFNRATESWSAAQPALSLPAASGKLRATWVPRPLFATASWALAACVLFGAAILTTIHRHNGSLSPAVAAELQQDSPAQIEQDNKLLMAIEREIRVDDRSPVQEYGIRTAASRRAKARGELTNQ